MSINHARPRAGTLGLMIGTAIGGSLLVTATAAASTTTTTAPADHITICHATGTPDDSGNGYILISPSKQGNVSGHANWDFKEHIATDNGHAADIIPSFEYEDNTGETQSYPGQNWGAEGQAILANGCQEITTTSPTTDPSTSTTTDPSTSTTTSTTTHPSTSTTTHPVTTQTSPGASQPMTTAAPVIAGEGHTPAAVQTDGLTPRDGASNLMTALGLGALIGTGGVALTLAARRAALRRH